MVNKGTSRIMVAEDLLNIIKPIIWRKLKAHNRSISEAIKLELSLDVTCGKVIAAYKDKEELVISLDTKERLLVIDELKTKTNIGIENALDVTFTAAAGEVLQATARFYPMIKGD